MQWEGKGDGEVICFHSCFCWSCVSESFCSEVPSCNLFLHLEQLWWNNLSIPISCKIFLSRASVSLVLCCFPCIWHGMWQVAGPSPCCWTADWISHLAGLFSAGGLDVKSQEAALRAAPDILIATPGRLIDHLHNCPSFHLSSIEVLILDEADRYTWSGRAPSALGSCGPHRRREPATSLFYINLAIAICMMPVQQLTLGPLFIIGLDYPAFFLSL